MHFIKLTPIELVIDNNTFKYTGYERKDSIFVNINNITAIQEGSVFLKENIYRNIYTLKCNFNGYPTIIHVILNDYNKGLMGI